MISVTIKSQFFYYIKIFAYETKNGRGGQNMNFVEKNFFWKFFLQSKFSLEVRRSRKIQQILKILIFKDYFLTHATFLLTKYFSKFCHFFILLHKFQNFQKNFKILKFFSKFSKFLQNLSEICQNWFIKSIFCLNLQKLKLESISKKVSKRPFHNLFNFILWNWVILAINVNT